MPRPAFVPLVALVIGLGTSAACADAVEDFYKGKTITIVTSTGVGGPFDLTARALENDIAARAAAEEAEREMAARQVTGTRTSLALEDYAGTYDSQLYGTLDVVLENGRLVATLLHTLRAPLEHWHYDTFRATWSEAALGRSLITFALDATGKVASLEVDGLGRFRRAPAEGRDR